MQAQLANAHQTLGIGHVRPHALSAQTALARLGDFMLDQVACPTVPTTCRLQRRADVLHAATACSGRLLLPELSRIAVETRRDVVVTRTPSDARGDFSILFDVLLVEGQTVRPYADLQALVLDDRFGIALVSDDPRGRAYLLDADGLSLLVRHPFADLAPGDRARRIMDSAASFAAVMAGTA